MDPAPHSCRPPSSPATPEHGHVNMSLDTTGPARAHADGVGDRKSLASWLTPARLQGPSCSNCPGGQRGPTQVLQTLNVAGGPTALVAVPTRPTHLSVTDPLAPRGSGWGFLLHGHPDGHDTLTSKLSLGEC